jgi:hypothetical protein
MFHLAPDASDWYIPEYHIGWRVGGVVTQRIANPCTPVRFRYSPPNSQYSLFINILSKICQRLRFNKFCRTQAVEKLKCVETRMLG